MDAWIWQLGLGLLIGLVIGLALRSRTPRQDLSGAPRTFQPPPVRPGLTSAPAPPPAARTSAASTGSPSQVDPATAVQIADALARCHKIEAIKLLREATGLGLKESKDAVERMTAP